MRTGLVGAWMVMIGATNLTWHFGMPAWFSVPLVFFAGMYAGWIYRQTATKEAVREELEFWKPEDHDKVCVGGCVWCKRKRLFSDDDTSQE